MRQSLVIIPVILLLASPTAHASFSQADEESISVVIHGKFLVGETRNGRDGLPKITANGIAFALEFKKNAPSPARLTALHNRKVVVRGTLKKDEQDHLVCVVDGDVAEDKAPGKAAQYLVGYHDGEQATVTELGQTLGLKMIDNNATGKYLILESNEATDPRFLEKLKEHKAVRYVEKNLEYKIPEK